MAKMKILRTHKCNESGNKYKIELVEICEKFCTYITDSNGCKLWHMSDSHSEEKPYFNKVVAANIGYLPKQKEEA